MASEFQFASVETTPSYSDILDELERDLRRERPSDVLQFCANYFNGKLAEQREILLSQTNLDPSGKVRALFFLGLTVHVTSGIISRINEESRAVGENILSGSLTGQCCSCVCKAALLRSNIDAWADTQMKQTRLI
jgi:hypothetical protein